MPNSIFQSVIIQFKDVTGRVLGVIDSEGTVVSCTDVSLLGERWPDAVVKVVGDPEQRITSGIPFIFPQMIQP